MLLYPAINHNGLFKKINIKDFVLKEILLLEGVVQLIEYLFYVWVIFAIHNLNKVTPRRYIDWSFSTPIMLISTIVFMKYQENKEKNIDKSFRMIDFFKENKINILKIKSSMILIERLFEDFVKIIHSICH